MVNQTKRALYRKVGQKSLCKGKSVSNPNRCKKVKGCKVASGSKRTYCRKRTAKRYKKKGGSKGPMSGGSSCSTSEPLSPSLF